MVDNEERNYFEGVFWAGLSGVAYLPSTILPTGLGLMDYLLECKSLGPSTQISSPACR